MPGKKEKASAVVTFHMAAGLTGYAAHLDDCGEHEKAFILLAAITICYLWTLQYLARSKKSDTCRFINDLAGGIFSGATLIATLLSVKHSEKATLSTISDSFIAIGALTIFYGMTLVSLALSEGTPTREERQATRGPA